MPLIIGVKKWDPPKILRMRKVNSSAMGGKRKRKNARLKDSLFLKKEEGISPRGGGDAVGGGGKRASVDKEVRLSIFPLSEGVLDSRGEGVGRREFGSTLSGVGKGIKPRREGVQSWGTITSLQKGRSKVIGKRRWAKSNLAVSKNGVRKSTAKEPHAEIAK